MSQEYKRKQDFHRNKIDEGSNRTTAGLVVSCVTNKKDEKLFARI